MNGMRHLLEWFNDPANWRGDAGVPHRVVEHLWFWAWSMAIAVAVALTPTLSTWGVRRLQQRDG